ncbi:hypothetical protein [Acaryochloris marina]|uniref:Uncharacterized protein n=1 Tax=Acaryochloris marina (strain MBIC 11017) TaxID=329726 RepID=B0CCE7_ACAM1|nr:hypothetical protein [Acaryochloris marina]ABW27976.1 hypothetical protein AM1_2980 [Acaryochloris marina MBIC11017]BDM82691.1 hypothetical protein AM10699_55520 [Acaryochloris marina MBIC10699]
MSDSIFALFLGFGFIWILMGVGGMFLLMKSQNQPLRFNRDGILVFLPIVLVFLIALSFGAVVLAKSG